MEHPETPNIGRLDVSQVDKAQIEWGTVFVLRSAFEVKLLNPYLLHDSSWGIADEHSARMGT